MAIQLRSGSFFLTSICLGFLLILPVESRASDLDRQLLKSIMQENEKEGLPFRESQYLAKPSGVKMPTENLQAGYKATYGKIAAVDANRNTLLKDLNKKYYTVTNKWKTETEIKTRRKFKMWIYGNQVTIKKDSFIGFSITAECQAFPSLSVNH